MGSKMRFAVLLGVTLLATCLAAEFDNFIGTDNAQLKAQSRQLQQVSAPAAAPGNSSSNNGGAGLIQDFVARSGTRFVVQSRDGQQDSCETFYFAGANTYYLMIRAADPKTRPQVLEILDSAKDLGLKVLRMWAFNEGPLQYNTLQRYPGVYDDKVLVGLDFVINEASKRGIRVVLVFANYWAMYGGIDQYNIWSFEAGSGNCNGDSTCRDDFFSDPVAIGYYKDHVKKLINRVNTFNQRLYREDPTIFGYNLMNEPRSQAELYIVKRKTNDGSKNYNISYNPGDDLQKWIEDMASYIKTMDPIHLLSTGQEGFAANSTPLYMYSNPGAWASLLGVDFVRNSKAKGIDYATMHVYVDQWLCVAEGSTTEGQLDFMKTWIEARQQAAEEELEMPVVLEEFGCKLDKRPGQYKIAYDSCLESAKRGGSCAGVMFWDLAHKDYAPLDPYLDGILRFGGGYSNMLGSNASNAEQRNVVFNEIRNYASAVAAINQKTAGKDTCVFVPPPQQGLGCKDVGINWDEGGMPWTCLPGEPPNVNWCNGAGGADLYRNPPEAWRGANTRGLPYNTIEVLILGNITNDGTKPLNLKNSWMIIPFSMGVQTQFEGIWKRQANPTNYFKIYCWDITDSNGDELCDNGVSLAFTNYSWPIGVKRDRGLNITFTKDIILQPKGWLGAPQSGNGANVLISFKDDKNHFRLDVSSLGLKGSLSCPANPVYSSWPPPPPPLPKPCKEGPDSRRGCPHFEWYWANATATQQGRVSTASIQQGGRRRQLLADTAATPPAPTSISGSPQSQGVASGYFGSGPFLRTLNSVSKSIPASTLGVTSGKQYVITTNVQVDGSIRKPRNITRPGATSIGNPHPDATGLNKAKGVDVLLTLQYSRTGLSGPTYMVLGRARVVPGNGTEMLRGVFSLGAEDDLSGSAVVYAETAHPGMTLSLDTPKVYLASDLSNPNVVATLPANLTDPYEPCTVIKDHGYTGVWEVELDNNRSSDTLNIEMCSPGGYDQALKVYQDGKVIASNSPEVFQLSVPVKAGSRYLIVVEGTTGDPYGGYRGQPGVRLKWQSGSPFAQIFDAAPTSVNASQFLRIDGHDLVIDCKRAAYVGVNTWDLMDKSRDLNSRPEIQSRMDAMVKAGWSVGRTWGFSLGSGLSDSPLGKVIADPTKILETAPGVYNEEVFASLDWVLAEAADRNLKIILPIEDYWLSIDRFVNWSSTAVSKDDFYTDQECRTMYKNHLNVFVHRKNTVNGRIYKEDPTIFYWNLINEPRCTGCGFALQQWVEEMAVYMKAIDPNHLVTIGEEGFYSTTCERAFLNPGAGKRREGISSSPWAAQEGQDFLANHIVPSIDLITTHIWSDNWMGYADYAGDVIDDNFDYTHGKDFWKEKLDYTNSWLSAHISDANAIGKPLIVEEFGKAKSAKKVYTGELINSPKDGETVASGNGIRDQFLQAVYEQISQNVQNGGVAQGSNFWNLYSVGVGSDDPYQITLADTSTMAIVAAHQKNISQYAGNAEKGTCSTTTTDSNAVPFPGYQAGNWTTPPGPPMPLMAGFTPIIDSSGAPANAPSGSPSGSSDSSSGSSGSSPSPPPSSPPPSSPPPNSPPPPSPSNTAG
ncbi:g2795 [Coccomyxa elongata]